jgi:hypothetical protein
MKKSLIVIVLFTITGCNSYSDAEQTIRNLYSICDHDSFRVSRVSEGETEKVNITCNRIKK